MKILFFSPYFYPYTSGITTYPYKILINLAKKNDITVLTLRHDKTLPETQSLNKLKITRMPYLLKISKGFISPQSIIYSIKKIKESNLVFLNIPNFEGLPLVIIAKIIGKPVISIFHCQVFLKKNFFNRIINLFIDISIFIQLSLSSKIIAYTEDYFNSLKISKAFIKKTEFILPPIELPKINAEKLKKLKSLKVNKTWIGYAGRVASEKGLEYLIAALTPEGWPNGLPSGVELILAGPYGNDVAGENSYYLKIKNLLDINNLKYRFLGNLTNGNLGAFYKSIDVLVLPSINQTEAFGMVQAEAMISGTPVIASNLPGVRVPIKLTKMGILIEPKNSIQLIEAIKEILKSKKKYTDKKLIDNAKKIFDIKKTYKFYDDLLSFRRRPESRYII